MPMIRSITLALWLCACVCACTSSPPRPRAFPVVLHAELPEGKALAGARFWADGRELGVSNAAGSLHATLQGSEGDAVSITAICPAGHRGPSTPRRLTLRTLAATDARRASTLELSLRCEPEVHLAALVVRSRLAGKALSVPVYVDGERIGLTDAHGIGHFLLHVAPRQSVRVQLDTHGAGRIAPENPVRSFEVDESESILLFDQAFDAARKPRVRPAVPPPSSQKVRAPYRIE